MFGLLDRLVFFVGLIFSVSLLWVCQLAGLGLIISCACLYSCSCYDFCCLLAYLDSHGLICGPILLFVVAIVGLMCLPLRLVFWWRGLL